MELTSAIVTLGTIRLEDSGTDFELKNDSLDVWAWLGVNPLDTLRTSYRASDGRHSQQPTMPCHPTLTSPSVHHSSHQSTALCLSYYNVT